MTKINQHNVSGFILMFFCFLVMNVQAQKSWVLIVQPVAGDKNNIASLNLEHDFSTKTACIKYVNQLPQMLAVRGFAAASVDAVKEDSISVTIQLFAGEQYEWSRLSVNDSDKALLTTLGYTTGNILTDFSAVKLQQLYDNILNYYSNNGYPFARVFLKNISISNNKIAARLNIDKGIVYHIDTIIVEGNMHISRTFLLEYLQIQQRDMYDEAKLNTINQRLALLSYLQQSRPWQTEMLNTGAALHLYLQQTRNNSVNILVGLLPENDQVGGKLLFTGEATVGLRNSFGKGETFNFNWQQLQPKSPQLTILYQQPYIFHSKFGAGANFSLFKQDSQYLNINGQLNIQYELSQQQTGAIIIQTASTNVLSVDTNAVIASNMLPTVADVSSTSVGLQYSFFNTDYRFNPRRGSEFNITGSFGNNTIKKNNTVVQIKNPAFNANSLYDSVKLHSYQLKLQGSAARYFQLGRQSTFKLGINAGFFQSPNSFQNELFRIGGFRLLRGFDEQSIYANVYSVETAEYRYLLGRNSWFYGFTDFGYASYNVNEVKFNHTYIGFGVGLSLETNTGIFSISLANGKRDDTNLNFQQLKIHLGFVSLF